MYGIYVRHVDGTPTKKWDLCDRCYRSLQKGIKAGGK